MARRKTLHPVDAYAEAVVSGKVVAGELIRLACERHLRDLKTCKTRGLYFDYDAADHALEFFRFLRHSKGEWAGCVFQLEPWQQFIVGSIFGWMRADGTRRFRTAFIECPRKQGKSTLAAGVGLYLFVADGEPGAEIYSAAPLALDTPVCTLEGWKKLGDIKVGDKVFNENGEQATVTYLSPIVQRKTYKLTFDDGSEIIATDNHLWTLEKRYTPRKGASQKYKTVTVTTEEIARTVNFGGRPRYRIKVTKPLQFDEKNLPIDPYVLGVWLGDGRNNRGAIVCENGDAEIIREIEQRGYNFSRHYSAKPNLTYGTVLGLRTKLRELGLLDNKHIPDLYKRASIGQRMDLLRGLMDTDGTITQRGECRFCNCSERLANDVYELVLGLGFKAHIRKAPTANGGTAWIVSFKAYKERPVFNLRRKQQRQLAKSNIKTQYRWIVDIRQIDPVPARCIEVDSPSHLFLVGKTLIATHNTKRDQAKIVWDEAANMVKRSPALAKRIKVYPGKANMHILESRAKFEPLGADADTLDGLNIHGAIIDELHAHKTRAVWDVLETATGARRQPLVFTITTAGTDQASVCYEIHDYAVQLLKGTISDDSFFAYIATIDEGDDWTDPKVWEKANPNLGVSVKIDDLKRKCEKAKKIPAAQNAFLRYHLNVWTQQVDRWIDLSLWDEQGKIIVEEELRGRVCYGGLDLSSVSDITAWVLVFPHEDDPETVDVLARFWVPEARLHDDQNRYRDQYRVWAQQGYLQVTPGDAIDYGFIKAQILKDAQTFRLVDLNIDRLFQAHQLAVELMDEGLTVVGMGQGFASMAAPMKEFERRLLAHKIRHGGNPVLRWMADNVAVKQDAAGNLKPDKASSQGKIDGIVALVMALDRAMRHEKTKQSVYEERGIVVL